MEMERMSQTISTASRSGDMLPAPLPLSVEAEKLALRIERAVRRGTSDKVRELKVVIAREGIHLTGRCGTYYCKQLAQTAAMAIAGKEATLLNRIEVW
jgi:hypothetical protein